MAVISDLAILVTANTTGLTRGLKRAGTQLQAFAKKVIRIDRLLLSLSKRLLKVGRSLAGLGGLGAGIGASVGVFSVIREGIKFESELTRSLSIQTDVARANREEFRKRTLTLAKQFGQSPSAVAQSVFFVASAGIKDTQEQLATLTKIMEFATAGSFDLAEATDLVTDAQSALGLDVGNAAERLRGVVRVQDVLVKANTLANASVRQFAEAITAGAGADAKSFGVSLEELVATLAVFAKQGVKSSDASTQFRIALRDLTTKAIKFPAAFKRFGITIFDTLGRIRPLADILRDFEDSFEGLSAGAKKFRLIDLGLADKSISAILKLIGNSKFLAETLLELENNAEGFSKKVSDLNLDAVDVKIKRVIATFQELGAELVKGLVDRGFFDELVLAAQTFVGSIKGTGPLLARAADAAAIAWQKFLRILKEGNQLFQLLLTTARKLGLIDPFRKEVTDYDKALGAIEKRRQSLGDRLITEQLRDKRTEAFFSAGGGGLTQQQADRLRVTIQVRKAMLEALDAGRSVTLELEKIIAGSERTGQAIRRQIAENFKGIVQGDNRRFLDEDDSPSSRRQSVRQRNEVDRARLRGQKQNDENLRRNIRRLRQREIIETGIAEQAKERAAAAEAANIKRTLQDEQNAAKKRAEDARVLRTLDQQVSKFKTLEQQEKELVKDLRRALDLQLNIEESERVSVAQGEKILQQVKESFRLKRAERDEKAGKEAADKLKEQAKAQQQLVDSADRIIAQNLTINEQYAKRIAFAKLLNAASDAEVAAGRKAFFNAFQTTRELKAAADALKKSQDAGAGLTDEQKKAKREADKLRESAIRAAKELRSPLEKFSDKITELQNFRQLSIANLAAGGLDIFPASALTAGVAKARADFAKQAATRRGSRATPTGPTATTSIDPNFRGVIADLLAGRQDRAVEQRDESNERLRRIQEATETTAQVLEIGRRLGIVQTVEIDP